MEIGEKLKVIVCLDDNNGMMFNRRRQSSDAVLTRRIAELAAGTKLWVSPYTAKLFTDDSVCVADDFLNQAEAGDYCFVEDADVVAHMDRIEKLIVYRWNRSYPSDQKFPALGTQWRLVATEEFEGNSHPVITEEVYVR